MRKILKTLIVVFCLCSLQGCMNVATTSAQAVYNHHSIQKTFKDQVISMRANQALHYTSHDFQNANLVVATHDREVLLTGQAPEAWQKTRAEEIIRKIPDVKTVYNLVSIASPSSILTRMSDTWITGKVKASLIASDKIDPTQVKVVTENGTVYLMGVLKPEEANEAVELARTTEGVQKVVKIFSYIHISRS